jgi:hypothetical protein
MQQEVEIAKEAEKVRLTNDIEAKKQVDSK